MKIKGKAFVFSLIMFVNVLEILSQPVEFPIKISENGRYFVDQKNKPFLLNGDSPWEMVWQLTKEESSLYIRERSAQGFNALLIYLLPVTKDEGHPFTMNRCGDLPFQNPDDFTTAVDAYFDHAEWIVKEAQKNNLLVQFFPVTSEFLEHGQMSSKIMGLKRPKFMGNIVYYLHHDYVIV